MPRSTVPLTAAKVATLLRSGAPVQVPDGRSLYLVVKAPGVGIWKGHYKKPRGVLSENGKPAWGTKSLGSAADVKLADARSAWERFKGERRNGTAMIVPALASAMALPGRAVPTGKPYREAVVEYVTGMAHEWRGGAMGKYAGLFTADAKATMPDGRVLGALTWPELSDDVIAAYVGTMSERNAKDTTVRLRSIRRYQETGKLPTRAAKVEHHDAMPYKDVPALYRTFDLTDQRACALAFTIMTGVRIGDVLGTKEKAPATWAEVDSNVWNIPGERTKNGEPHSVPLTAAALKLIGDRKDSATPLFNTGYFKVYRFFEKAPFDIHGFRASLRTWAQDQGFDYDAAERVLQHPGLGDRSVMAYKRSELLAARRAIMEKWSDFVTSGSA